MKEFTGDALERRVATSLAAALGATIETRKAAGDDDPLGSWRRVAFADGVELHVRDDSPSSRDEALVAMREAVRLRWGGGYPIAPDLSNRRGQRRRARLEQLGPSRAMLERLELDLLRVVKIVEKH